jgi:hypothetical protein
MWQEMVKIHPAAEMFPMMSPAELEELARDISDHGLRNGIVFWTPEDLSGKRPEEIYLLDGRNRLAAIELAYTKAAEREEALRDAIYINPEQERCASLLRSETDPYAYVVSVNIRRRHLDAEQKRGIIAKLLKENPERSDRATAQIAGVSHHTVAAVRAEAEGTGQIAQLDKRTGADGKERPAHKPSAQVVDLPNAGKAQEPKRRTVNASEAKASDKRVDSFIRAAKNLSDDEFTIACNWFDEYRIERGDTVFDRTNAGRK